jgi:hypothetical protein
MKFGDRLRNGATVIQHEGDVVLAHWEGERTPWITWMTDPEGRDTYWGHYHKDLDAALKDYNERLGK